jgi:hypothetical protein
MTVQRINVPQHHVLQENACEGQCLLDAMSPGIRTAPQWLADNCQSASNNDAKDGCFSSLYHHPTHSEVPPHVSHRNSLQHADQSALQPNHNDSCVKQITRQRSMVRSMSCPEWSFCGGLDAENDQVQVAHSTLRRNVSAEVRSLSFCALSSQVRARGNAFFVREACLFVCVRAMLVPK